MSKIIRQASYVQTSSFSYSLVTGKKIKFLTQFPRAARPMQNSKPRKMQNGV